MSESLPAGDRCEWCRTSFTMEETFRYWREGGIPICDACRVSIEQNPVELAEDYRPQAAENQKFVIRYTIGILAAAVVIGWLLYFLVYLTDGAGAEA